MSLGKNTFCNGVEPYNFRDTGETVCTITANVGQSTAIGPKVAIRKCNPSISRKSATDDGVVGTIDASIYKKNNRQDNSKYIIEKKGNEMMTMQEAIKEINKDAPHQQDMLQHESDAARSLVAGTHGASSHLTKTICEDEFECVVRRLTTTETSRLQGFPDNHTKIDGPETSDAPQYKTHGNSWATPCAFFMSSRMESEMRRLGVEGTIKYATCCSGIEAHSVSVRTLDWKSMFFSEIEPFPCRVLAHHFPKTPNLGDMTQIHFDKDKGVITNTHAEGEEYSLPSCFKEAEIQEIPFSEGDLHVFSGGTPCFTKGAFVLTKEGYKAIEDIRVGDEVLTHLGRFRKVLRIGNKKSNELVDVYFDGCKKITCTADHPFPLLTATYKEDKGFVADNPVLMPIKDGVGKFAQRLATPEFDSGVTKDNASFNYGDYECIKVNKVEPLVGKTDTVYNIEVEEDHTYIVNGIVTHNCQSISVAGKREGMAEGSGTRSSLAFHYQRIIEETQPMFTLWENVPGAFSSNGGADFIWFVNKCAESGYSMAWRVLDAQYTMTEEFPRAVPQRRRRIWLVGYRGNDWRIPARIVFEMEKELTKEPPVRIPGKGFMTLNPDFVEGDIDIVSKTKSGKKNNMESMFEISSEEENKHKVSKLIPFDVMPNEPDFSKVSMADKFSFAKLVGEPGFIGTVFRTDKKKAKKILVKYVDLFSVFESDDTNKDVEPENIEPEDWVGAEKISPGILDNIGNAGILANGHIMTINCHEWTSGIQVGPEKIKLMEEGKNITDSLPEAYDGTVCGLSDVLEDNPDEKYNLSWRACYGILNRASKRGKELPPALYTALISTIRKWAGVVKWFAVNGKDIKKKESDQTEREIARACFDAHIGSVIAFDDVVAEKPSSRNSDDEESDDQYLEEDENYSEDNDDGFGNFGTPTLDESGEVVEASGNESAKEKIKLEVPDFPNGVINVSGGETAATLLASGDAAVGTTQDANVIALKHETISSCDTKLDASRVEEEVSSTILASSYKEPPAVFPNGGR